MSRLILTQEVPGGQFLVFDSRPSFEFASIKQTHSNIVVNPISELVEADGIVTQDKIILAIQTADCLPIYLNGANGVALIHAGWKGLHNKILNSKLIHNIKPQYAYIGPSIYQESYEISSEFLTNFPSEFFNQTNEKITFSLQNYAHHQLKSFFSNIKVEESKICTFKDDRFHSYRQNKTKSRNWNLFVPDGLNIDYNISES